MAVTPVILSGYEVDDYAADKPIIGAQMIPVAPDSAQWTTVGTVAAADETDADYPARRAYDGLPHLDTRPDTSASTWYYVLDLGTTVDIDFACIIGHNYGTLSLTTVELEVADDAAFAVNLRPIGDFGSPADDTRLMDLVLTEAAAAYRYEDVQYARLKLSKGISFTPQMHELILGRRRQLQYNPIRPWDPHHLVNQQTITSTRGGAQHKQVFSKGAFGLSALYEPCATTRAEDITAWWQDDYGARPFVWIENPTSAPDSWHLIQNENEEFAFPYTGPVRRRLQLEGIEQGPEAYFLARGLN